MNVLEFVVAGAAVVVANGLKKDTLVKYRLKYAENVKRLKGLKKDTLVKKRLKNADGAAVVVANGVNKDPAPK